MTPFWYGFLTGAWAVPCVVLAVLHLAAWLHHRR